MLSKALTPCDLCASSELQQIIWRSEKGRWDYPFRKDGRGGDDARAVRTEYINPDIFVIKSAKVRE